MKKSEIVGSLPALGTSLLPNLACPACWPAYASLLSAVGLTFLAESKYLFWVNASALFVGLVVLSRRVRVRGYRPLALGVMATALILFGKFEFRSNTITWLGAAIYVAAFVWSSAYTKSAPPCPKCVTNPWR